MQHIYLGRDRVQLVSAVSAGLELPSGLLVRVIRRRGRRVAPRVAEKPIGFTTGDHEPPVVDTEFGRIGLMICYDLEFPEWVRTVALQNADLLCAPVNWPSFPRPKGERLAEITRVQANAAVNRLPIAVADRTNNERDIEWVGGTVIVNADGFPLTKIHLGEAAIVYATVDLAESRNKRISDNNDILVDRRPHLYHRVTAPHTESS